MPGEPRSPQEGFDAGYQQALADVRAELERKRDIYKSRYWDATIEGVLDLIEKLAKR